MPGLQTVEFFRIVVVLIVGIFSFVFWSRTGKRGFAWIGAAFFLSLVSLATRLLILRLVPTVRPFDSNVRLLMKLSYLRVPDFLFAIFIAIGLHDFYTESLPVAPPQPREERPWPEVALAIRRRFFVSFGALFVLGGPWLVFRGGPMVGVGFAMGFMALVCLWLGLHPRSPLVHAKSDRETR